MTAINYSPLKDYLEHGISIEDLVKILDDAYYQFTKLVIQNSILENDTIDRDYYIVVCTLQEIKEVFTEMMKN